MNPPHRRFRAGIFRLFLLLAIAALHDVVQVEAQIVSGLRWSGTWNESGTSTEDGCYLNQGDGVSITIYANGGNLSGSGIMTGFNCHYTATCAFIAYAPASVQVSGNITGNNIYLLLQATCVDGPCAGDVVFEDFTGTIQGDSIVASRTAPGIGSRQITLSTQGNSSSKSTGESKGPGNVKVADPIDLATGNMFDKTADFMMSVGGFGFTRYYNSFAGQNIVANSLGRNWRSSLDRFLRIGYSGGVPVIIIAERPDGRELQFSLVNQKWVCDTDVDLILTPTNGYWVISDSQDNQEVYLVEGDAGYLKGIVSRSGDTQILISDSAHHVTSVSNSFNKVLTFTYQNDLLRTLTTPGGLIVTYGYTSSGQSGSTPDRLATVTYSTSPQTTKTYLYENPSFPFAITGVIDENGQRYGIWTYDSHGRALTSQHANGSDFTSIFYNDADGSRAVTNALGAVTLYSFVGSQGVSKLSKMDRLATASFPAASFSQTYDAKGYVATRTDWNGNVTIYSNDNRGLPTNIVEAVGTAQQRTTTIVYHPSMHLPLRIAAPGITTDFSYNSKGDLLQKTETDTTTSSVPYSTAGQSRTWAFTYNSLGQVVTQRGPRTNAISISTNFYDIFGNLSATSDALGHVTKFASYDNQGLLLTMIDANGVTNNFTYDVLGRLLTRTILAASGNSTNRFSYDGVGMVKQITLPDGSSLSYQYDAARRIIAVTNSNGESIQYTPDAAGNIVVERTLSSNGTIVKTQSRIFDELSRLIRQIGGASQTNYFTYDKNGNQQSITDGLNHRTIQAFDALNRLNLITDPLNNNTRTDFDGQSNLIKVSDPRSLATQYVRDGFGRVIQKISPDAGITTYTFDEAGNCLSQKDARGVVTLRSFDKLDRKVSETFPVSPGENVTFSYDSTTGSSKGIGRLTGFTDETGSTTLAYDERGNLTNSTRVIGGKNYSMGYGFDLADRLVKIIYPSGHVITYTRDAVGNIKSVTYRPSVIGAVTMLASNITYVPFGSIRSMLFGNGLTRTNSYDLDYRLTAINTGGGVQSLGIAYDFANNIVTITNLLAATKTQRFIYDGNNRLIQASGFYQTNQYSYDGVGNRVTRKTGALVESYNYATTANRLQTTSKAGNVRAFSYTMNGNISSDDRNGSGILSFGYGNQNRYNNLSSNGISIATYKYDALGQRLIKSLSSGTIHFHYNAQAQLIAETQSDGANLREYVWLDSMPIAQIEANGTVYYIHPDHLNSPQKMTDASKNIVWDSEQQPFGETRRETYFSSLTSISSNLFQVTIDGGNSSKFLVEASTNLGNGPWTSIYTNSVIPFSFIDNNAGRYKSRFYRIAIPPNGTTSSSVVQNLRFPGQYFDAESGLHYNLMRDYDPTLGRYMQNDPIGLSGGVNLYGYCGANPIMGSDALGLDIRIYAIGLHEAIEIDVPGNSKISFGFGPVNLGSSSTDGLLPFGPGRIDEGNQSYSSLRGGKLVSSRQLSLEDGEKLVTQLRAMKENPPLYSLLSFNCNTFANMVSDLAGGGKLSIKSFAPLDINRF